MDRVIVTLDDRDPSVRYSGDWVRSSRSEEFNSTTTNTRSRGAAAIIAFNGTSISVYGTIDTGSSQDAVSTYTLDDSDSAEQFTGRQMSTVQYRQMFYNSTELPYGQHVLVVKNAVEGGQFFLDCVEITTERRMSPSVGMSMSMSMSTSTAAVVASSSGSNMANDSQSSGISKSAIIGVAFTGIIVFAMFICFVRLCYKQYGGPSEESQRTPRAARPPSPNVDSSPSYLHGPQKVLKSTLLPGYHHHPSRYGVERRTGDDVVTETRTYY